MVNGSKGVLQGLELKLLASGAGLFASIAIVKFPGCPIQLDGLPLAHFPIYPKLASISIGLHHENGKTFQLVVQCQQLPLQLGFAATTHGTQGKTLCCIGSSMNCGPLKAYVIASCPQSCEGLVLNQPISLSHLNSLLNPHLLAETQ